jgi:hypothetical protein
MGRDNQPRTRQKKQLERKQSLIEQFDRILIVSEGSKTEPNYIQDILRHYRIPSASYCILPSQYGTSPKQVVEFALDIFSYGESRQRIEGLDFDRVYVVFDRDEHKSYNEALKLIESINNNPLINKAGKLVIVRAIVSVPNFELWLLLHYKLVHGPISRQEVIRELKKHLTGYEKGNAGYFDATRNLLQSAFKNSNILAKTNKASDGDMPYTSMGELVEYLMNIKA